MTRRAKKADEKREVAEPTRPAGIQAMDLKLYVQIQQVIRCLGAAGA